ncbi:hypothetical protein GW943_00090 [Candidatus Parcubacteria bacterium]|uniref:Uncharacterized protein n=1 Tax=Candidatus Kaiserbacteria bacterium CG10_big_fil_rev_8_21_14_0_10_47_16 TaxID=1974608 RepID=A0A2H0UCY5_9BACT|nr:hypothetical protein [Candidatus Parcubacteria bacterium]PIR84251.1 MAG: hypothetical protein COU16_01465 [Candidatus Kaiserbacteria bacterium CG10_big_fil_rev_8_21_14_0_10_47_16]
MESSLPICTSQEEFINLCLANIEERAFTLLYEREVVSNTPFLFVALQYDDVRWKPLLDAMLPEHVLEPNEKSIVIGALAYQPACQWFARKFSDIADELTTPPPEGKVRALLIREGVLLAYNVRPHKDTNRLN